MSVTQGMTMVGERKNSSGCDENITCISDTSCDTSSSSDDLGSVSDKHCYDDGYIPHLVPVSHLAPVSHIAPVSHLAPVSHIAPIVDSNMILDVVKKNTAALNLLLENYHRAQPNLVIDHASGRPVCYNQPVTATRAVGAVQLGTNTMQIPLHLSSGSDFMYDFVNNDNNGLVCTAPEEDFEHPKMDNMDNLFLDDELDIILPDDDTLMFIEELKSTIQ